MSITRIEAILALDGPKDTSDKKWLIRELENNGCNLSVIDLKQKISEIIFQRKPFFRVKMYAEVVRQAIKINKAATHNTVVFVWKPMSAVVLNWLREIRKKEYNIISFGWLNPNKDIYFRLNRKAFISKHFYPVVNLDKNIERYRSFYGLSDTSRFLFMPDVYDDSSDFDMRNTSAATSNYFFSGGIANRDFESVISVAKKMKDLKFVIVCDKDRINTKEVPSNVTIHCNIDKEHYYRLMKQSKASIVLLQKDKASGLINICKAIQEGVLCVSSLTESTSMYFPESEEQLLVPLGDIETLENVVRKINSLDEETYYEIVQKLQCHLHNCFSPEACVKKILEELERIKCL